MRDKRLMHQALIKHIAASWLSPTQTACMASVSTMCRATDLTSLLLFALFVAHAWGAHAQGDAQHWPWSQAGGAAGLGALNLAYLAPSQLAAALGYPGGTYPAAMSATPAALGYPGGTYPAASATPSELGGAAWGLAAGYGEVGAAASGGPSMGGAGGPAEGPPAAGDRAASSSSDNCMFEAEAPGGAHTGV